MNETIFKTLRNEIGRLTTPAFRGGAAYALVWFCRLTLSSGSNRDFSIEQFLSAMGALKVGLREQGMEAVLTVLDESVQTINSESSRYLTDSFGEISVE